MAKEKTAPVRLDSPTAGSLNSRRGLPLSTGHISSLLASLKLPPGGLSTSILSFAKFFSLPLDPSFLGNIRQAALAGGGGAESSPGPGEDSRSPRFREALALGALAAASKGLELSPEALARYAGALLHGGDAPHGERAAGVQGKENSGEEGAAGDSADDRSGGMPERGAPDREGGGSPGKERPGNEGRFPAQAGSSKAGAAERRLDASGLRESALAAQGPLLAILNRLPGKDGKRWIVLPFSLEELDMCLRILLAPPGGSSGGSWRVEQMGLDIRNGEESWRFAFHPGLGGGRGEKMPPLSLKFSWHPAPGQPRTGGLERELADLLGLPAAEVRQEALLSFAESRDWTLLSVNEEV
ncbi:MAG: hypothetical protein LBH51_05740 [Treponema sp.]|nr:hypothetical protein [Treponema sp.]